MKYLQAFLWTVFAVIAPQVAQADREPGWIRTPGRSDAQGALQVSSDWAPAQRVKVIRKDGSTAEITPAGGKSAKTAESLAAPQSVVVPMGMVLSGNDADAITPDIQALADSLRRDPVEIFYWVRNQVDYVHYYGVRKGAQLTLLERSGNDADQCALLVALLRASGIPAGYLNRVMSMPWSDPSGVDMAHWLNLDESRWSELVTSHGIPASEWVNDPNIAGYYAQRRVIVEATISGSTVLLDPSFKLYEAVSGLNLVSASGFTGANAASAAQGTETATSVAGLNVSGFKSYLAGCFSALRTAITTAFPSGSAMAIEAVGGYRIGSLQLVAGSIPWPYYPGNDEHLDVLPTTKFSKLVISAPNSLNYTTNLCTLGGRRLTLEFDSNNYAQLWLEDTKVAQATSAGSSPLQVTVAVNHPHGGAGDTDPSQQETKGYNQGANNRYLIVYGFDASAELIRQREAKLEAYRITDPSGTGRGAIVESLNILALNWLRETELAGRSLATSDKILRMFHHRFGRVAQTVSANGTTYYLDVSLQESALVPRLAAGNADASFVAEQLVASAMEHGVIAQFSSAGQSGASTVRVLHDRATGTIYRATPANWSTVQSSLSGYSGTDLSQIGSVVGSGSPAGNWVLLPSNGNVTISQWTGAGYVTYANQANGTRCDMIISGPLSGGFSVNYGAIDTSYIVSNYVADTSWLTASAAVAPPVHVGDPVDAASGQFTFSPPGLTIGADWPRGVGFSCRYDGGRRLQNDGNIGYGWDHSLNVRLVERSDYRNALGEGSAIEAAGGLTGTVAVLELCRDLSTAKKGTMAALAAYWLVDQLHQNGLSVVLEDKTYQFLKQPDGTYLPPRGSTLTLTRNTGISPNAWELKERQGRTFRFENATTPFRLAKIIDLWGRTATLAYDGSGRVAQATDAYGRTLTLTYNGSGQLTTVADTANSRSMTFSYTSGNLVTITDPEGKSDRFEYDGSRRLIRHRDHDNRIVVENTTFDSQNRVTGQRSQGDAARTWTFSYGSGVTLTTDPKGGRTSTYYDELGRPVGRLDELNRYWQAVFDGQDRLVASATPLGAVSWRQFDANHNVTLWVDSLGYFEYYQYDTQNRLVTKTDRNGKTTIYSNYNGTFQPQTVTNAAGEVTTMAYDAAGNLTSVTPPNSSAVTYTYNALDQQTRIDYPGGDFTTATYNAVGDMATATDARGNTTSTTYNNRREVLSTTAPGGIVASQTYDNARNVAATVNPRGKTTSFTYSATAKLLSTTVPGGATLAGHYDERDWMDTETDALGHSTQTAYLADGQINQTTDPLGRVRTASYDGDGRLVASVDPLNQWIWKTLNSRGDVLQVKNPVLNDPTGGASAPATGFGYDPAGRQVQRQNRRGGNWVFHYDDIGRLTSTVSPLGRTAAQTWNNRGLLGIVTEPSGETVNLSYDGRGRVTGKEGKTSGGATEYTVGIGYDGNGNVTTLTEGAATVTRTYDALNRVSSYQNAAGETLGYSYDANGNLTVLTYPDGKTVTYTYDDRDRLSTVTDWASRVTSYTWDANSRLVQAVQPNGTVRKFSYDAAGQTTQIEERLANGRIIYLQKLQRDAGGRVTGRMALPPPGAFSEPTLTAAYDLDDRMTSLNGQSLSYDSDGNLAAGRLPDGPWGGSGSSTDVSGTYTWDGRNRLTWVTRADTSETIGYGYDSEGHLITITNGGTTRLTVDPHGGQRSQVLVKTAPDGSKTRYVYGLGLLYEERPDGSVRYHHYDSLGSTVALTDATGTVTGTVQYGVFGAIAGSTGDGLSTSFLWEGRHGIYTDKNTGLHQMRARWYSTQLRRFLNPDPAGFAGGGNFYAFANGDPISLLDPFGLGAESSGGWNISSIIHTALDIASLVPVLNTAAGLTNAALYAFEGDYGNAALSAVTAIPLGGAVAAAGKIAVRAEHAVQATSAITHAAEDALKVSSKARIGLDTNAIIARLEGASADVQAIISAIDGRAPSVSITAVKEFLRGGGDVNALRSFLQSTGGGVGKVPSVAVVQQLQAIGMKAADARVVASAIEEGINVLTRDKQVLKKVPGIARSF